MTPEALCDLLGLHAAAVMIDLGEDLTPIYHLVTAGGEQVIAAAPWRTPRDKTQAVRQIRRIAHQRRAVMVGLVSEAWTVSYGVGEMPEVVDPPSQNPQRVEVVYATATDGAVTVTRSWQIVRSRLGGPVVSLVEMKGISGPAVRNRLLDGILPARAHR